MFSLFFTCDLGNFRESGLCFLGKFVYKACIGRVEFRGAGTIPAGEAHFPLARMAWGQHAPRLQGARWSATNALLRAPQALARGGSLARFSFRPPAAFIGWAVGAVP